MGRASCQPIRHNSFDHLYLSRVLPDPWWPKNRSSVSAPPCAHADHVPAHPVRPCKRRRPACPCAFASIHTSVAPAQSRPSLRASPPPSPCFFRPRATAPAHPCRSCSSMAAAPTLPWLSLISFVYYQSVTNTTKVLLGFMG
jgi:hypothetical protein